MLLYVGTMSYGADTAKQVTPVWEQDAGKVIEQSKNPNASRMSLIPGVKVGGSTRFADQWSVDYADTLKRSEASGKLAFMYFSGSNWCGFCKRLDSEILETELFQAYAAEHFELANLDFPRPAPKGDSNHDLNVWLKAQHGVKGFPTVLILNSNGAVVAQTGYVRGGPEAFIAALEELLENDS